MDEFTALAEGAQRLCYAARAPELQESAVTKIDALLDRLARHKEQCSAEGLEAAANMVLSMELSLATVRSELLMWLRLKREQPEGAWDSLVSAQGSLASAIGLRRQLGYDTRNLENRHQRLLSIERVVFPPQVFTSVGGIVSHRECSICESDYDECEHLVGHAYGGELCCRVIREFSILREVSFVEEPADKRCRATHFSDGGRMRNTMTWRLEERGDTDNNAGSDQQMRHADIKPP